MGGREGEEGGRERERRVSLGFSLVILSFFPPCSSHARFCRATLVIHYCSRVRDKAHTIPTTSPSHPSLPPFLPPSLLSYLAKSSALIFASKLVTSAASFPVKDDPTICLTLPACKSMQGRKTIWGSDKGEDRRGRRFGRKRRSACGLILETWVEGKEGRAVRGRRATVLDDTRGDSADAEGIGGAAVVGVWVERGGGGWIGRTRPWFLDGKARRRRRWAGCMHVVLPVVAVLVGDVVVVVDEWQGPSHMVTPHPSRCLESRR